MSAEFWAILGVGVALFSVGAALLGLVWRMFDSLRRGIYAISERLARIEEWIEGRFRESTQGAAS